MSSVTISKNKTDFPANHVTDDRTVTPKCQFCNSEIFTTFGEPSPMGHPKCQKCHGKPTEINRNMCDFPPAHLARRPSRLSQMVFEEIPSAADVTNVIRLAQPSRSSPSPLQSSSETCWSFSCFVSKQFAGRLGCVWNKGLEMKLQT
jgi:hypothetical protein